MKRRHQLPFGAEYLGDDQTRFTLWAPAAGNVELLLEDEALLMERDEDGTFTLIADAPPGTRYRYRVDGEGEVPDPASRHQPEDVHGPSAVVDPEAFEWDDGDWRGRPWEETILYELHVGAFTPEGTFAAAREKLDYLADLGVTAVEIMPLSDFPGGATGATMACCPTPPTPPTARRRN